MQALLIFSDLPGRVYTEHRPTLYLYLTVKRLASHFYNGKRLIRSNQGKRIILCELSSVDSGTVLSRSPRMVSVLGIISLQSEGTSDFAY